MAGSKGIARFGQRGGIFAFALSRTGGPGMRQVQLLLFCAIWPALAGPVFGKPGRPFLVLDAAGHSATVLKVAFTPNGKELITISRDKTVRFWDVGTGKAGRVFHLPVGAGVEGML